jgi:four helix bundle protein
MNKPDKMTVGASGYRRLRAWQRAMEMVEQIYTISTSFPRDERFGLTAQIRRAAVSVPSNIAEGNARSSPRDEVRFHTMALGSIAEVETQLELAVRLRFIEPQSAVRAFDLLDQTGRLITRLRQSLSPP